MSYRHGLEVLGADVVVNYTTLRATMLYPSSSAMTGVPWGMNKSLYGSDEVVNGRRRVNMNLGGTDYWVPSADVAPVLDITKSSDFVISDKPSTAASVVYKAEKVDQPKTPAMSSASTMPSAFAPPSSASVAHSAEFPWAIVVGAAGAGVAILGLGVWLMGRHTSSPGAWK